MTSSFFSRRQWLANALGVLLLTVTLSGCGGSNTATDSVSISSITYTPSSPTSGTAVAVTGVVSGSTESASNSLSYLWTQTSGPSVTLSGTTAATVYFTAPSVTSSTDIVLTLTATLGSATASKSVTISVAP